MKRSLLVILLCVFPVSGICGPSMAAGKKAVMFGDLSWDSIQFHNRVLAFILEKGWGYKADFTFSETMPGI